MEILHNHTKNFATIHYNLRVPSQVKKASEKRLCVISVIVVWNNIKFIREWSGLTGINNKFTNGVLPEHMGTLSTLFTIDTHIIHGFTFRTYFLSIYEFR